MSTSDDELEPDEYIVEAIRNWRYNLRNNQWEYFVKWHHYSEKENTWEPESNLNCPIILDNFKRSLSKVERRCIDTPNPELLSGFQRRAEFERCIGADGPHESDEEDSPKTDKQSFYCLLLFADSDLVEEVSLADFFQNEPLEAFKFCESRLFRKDKSISAY